MDILNLLESRKNALFESSKTVRENINKIIDDSSFVELDRYSFSANDENSREAQGDGVITGFATVNDVACYVVAQNSAVLSGGLTYQGAKKIVKCLDKALVAGAPVIYLLSSLGVCSSDGIKAMEGVALVLKKMQELKGKVPQFSIVLGDVFGSSSLIAATCDYNLMLKDGCLSYASPLVISAASDKNVDKSVVGGVKAQQFNGLTTFEIEDLSNARDMISDVLDILPAYGGAVLETSDDFNRFTPGLNEKVCAKCLASAVFDKDYYLELGKGYADDVVTAIGRVGGMSVAAVIFNGDEGVKLNENNVSKIQNFIYYANDNDLPLLTFINVCGIEENLETSNSLIMKKVSDLTYALTVYNEVPRVNVVYGKAIGLGYSLFASRAMGADYNYAFANAKISVFEKEIGAQIQYGVMGERLKAVVDEYGDNVQDAMNAARFGFFDDVIEPQYVRQYLIACLQTLI